MKHITLELSPESCQRAIAELRKYENELRPKLNEVCRRLAELGAEEARRRFARGDHGNTDAYVSTTPTENGWKIVAMGTDVYFIEFGTGFFAHPHGEATTVPVYPGSYSEQNAQQFSEYGYWWYEGEKLQGTEAEMPMYFAGEVIRANEKRIAREVFGK